MSQDNAQHSVRNRILSLHEAAPSESGSTRMRVFGILIPRQTTMIGLSFSYSSEDFEPIAHVPLAIGGAINTGLMIGAGNALTK